MATLKSEKHSERCRDWSRYAGIGMCIPTCKMAEFYQGTPLEEIRSWNKPPMDVGPIIAGALIFAILMILLALASALT